jgi:hypothetical protein
MDVKDKRRNQLRLVSERERESGECKTEKTQEKKISSRTE